MNTEWHKTHKMPINATIEERIAWHTEHLKNCQCRSDFPKKLIEKMKKRKLL